MNPCGTLILYLVIGNLSPLTLCIVFVHPGRFGTSSGHFHRYHNITVCAEVCHHMVDFTQQADKSVVEGAWAFILFCIWKLGNMGISSIHGTIPALNDRFKIWANGFVSVFDIHLRIWGLMLSSPGLLFVLKESISVFICFICWL